ncbi:hypothetical protein SLEP1_g57469 [Rubroshorea leprosula]|uniref:Uncharacterized protein n=1 Tax=Rubroshorea leprosula TaxID=152421 RepID=A0AAV5MNS5_9ROSI|nr:hypothetical protein SLEP1_g57469 [Rubroshorea leprosula]
MTGHVDTKIFKNLIHQYKSNLLYVTPSAKSPTPAL